MAGTPRGPARLLAPAAIPSIRRVVTPSGSSHIGLRTSNLACCIARHPPQPPTTTASLTTRCSIEAAPISPRHQHSVSSRRLVQQSRHNCCTRDDLLCQVYGIYHQFARQGTHTILLPDEIECLMGARGTHPSCTCILKTTLFVQRSDCKERGIASETTLSHRGQDSPNRCRLLVHSKEESLRRIHSATAISARQTRSTARRHARRRKAKRKS